MKTLIVDDDPICRMLLQSLLSRYGECHLAANGTEAVAAFGSAQAAETAYNLVCLDVMMPEMDGHAALRKIRALERAAGKNGTKIIMTTALDDTKNVTLAFDARCDAYLFKPIDTANLLDRLRSLGLIS